MTIKHDTPESQQAASVGGEREACAEWIERHYGFPAKALCLLNGKDLERAFIGGWQASAALSPAGGGVVMPTSDRCYDIASEIYGKNLPQDQAMKLALLVGGIINEFARLNAKPQANSQEGASEHLETYPRLGGSSTATSTCSPPPLNQQARHDQGDDTERLDFMIAKCARIGWNREGEYCGVFRDSDDDTVGDCLSGWGARFTDPREAIDAALTQSPKGEEE